MSPKPLPSRGDVEQLVLHSQRDAREVMRLEGTLHRVLEKLLVLEDVQNRIEERLSSVHDDIRMLHVGSDPGGYLYRSRC